MVASALDIIQRADSFAEYAYNPRICPLKQNFSRENSLDRVVQSWVNITQG